jgi:hypothetical protein
LHHHAPDVGAHRKTQLKQIPFFKMLRFQHQGNAGQILDLKEHSAAPLEHSVQIQILEPNNWRDAAVLQSGRPLSNDKKLQKADVGHRRMQIFMANKFKSILVLFFEACQKGRFRLIT